MTNQKSKRILNSKSQILNSKPELKSKIKSQGIKSKVKSQKSKMKIKSQKLNQILNSLGFGKLGNWGLFGI